MENLTKTQAEDRLVQLRKSLAKQEANGAIIDWRGYTNRIEELKKVISN